MTHNNYIYILVVAVVTYLIRVLPLTLIRREIKNRFLRSFLYYVPYVTLAAMTFPAILQDTASMLSGAAALAVAIVLAYLNQSLIVVALASSTAVFLVERLMGLPI